MKLRGECFRALQHHLEEPRLTCRSKVSYVQKGLL
jgi:hypothetical protein